MQEAKKKRQEVLGGKKEDQGAFRVFFLEMEGFYLFLGRLLGELLIFPLRLVLLSCCVMS